MAASRPWLPRGCERWHQSLSCSFPLPMVRVRTRTLNMNAGSRVLRSRRAGPCSNLHRGPASRIRPDGHREDASHRVNAADALLQHLGNRQSRAHHRHISVQCKIIWVSSFPARGGGGWRSFESCDEIPNPFIELWRRRWLVCPEGGLGAWSRPARSREGDGSVLSVGGVAPPENSWRGGHAAALSARADLW